MLEYIIICIGLVWLLFMWLIYKNRSKKKIMKMKLNPP